MKLSKILGLILLLLSILLLSLELNNLEQSAIGVKAIAMCLLILLYTIVVVKRNKFFMLFLLTFTVALCLDYFSYDVVWSYNQIDVYYVVCNGLYVLAYIFLTLRIFYLINVIKSTTKYPIQTLSLMFLGVFVVYMITDLTTSNSDSVDVNIVQIIYITVIVFMMCLSVMNYIYNDSKKSMILLSGTVMIVFSEVIQMAYYFLTDLQNALNIIYSFLTITAFAMFYFQSKLQPKQHVLVEPLESVEA
ncbi:hypothetical protein [Psychroserpens damuponensis]|uniref:hypothetical protein n=1 Tax=Psychroserpens damuponensis TaxID=943936 RepID=UPI00058B294E|nr:hypothetical protein [Psychroserpens damuponensis]